MMTDGVTKTLTDATFCGGDVVNKHLAEMRELKRKTAPHLTCADGFRMSVQASGFHYCTPRDDEGPYSRVEVGFPSGREELFMPYVEDAAHPMATVYGWVPVSVVMQVIRKHGGLV